MNFPLLPFPIRSALFAGVIFVAATTALHAVDKPGTLLTNGDFERGLEGWSTFVPAEFNKDGCQAETVNQNAHGGEVCARLTSQDFVRFGLSEKMILVTPKDRYRVIVWMHADDSTQVQSGQPGFVVRLALTKDGKDLPSGHFIIDLNNAVTRGKRRSRVPANRDRLPTAWTKVEAVVEIPRKRRACR